MSNINLFPELDGEQGPEQDVNNGHGQSRDADELIVFGYSCKLFRDDFSAKAIDRGQSLIPWNGDENVMIDRCASHDLLLCSRCSFYTITKSPTKRCRLPFFRSCSAEGRHGEYR